MVAIDLMTVAAMGAARDEEGGNTGAGGSTGTVKCLLWQEHK